MARGIIIIIWSVGVFAWPQVGLGQGTIYTWVDGKGSVHYSDTPTGQARSIDDELPPAASFGTQPDSASQAATPPPALPAQGVRQRPPTPLSVKRYSTKGKEKLKATRSDETKISPSGETGRSAQTPAMRLKTKA